MSMTVVEAFGSGTLSSGSNRRGEKKYIIFGVDLTSGDDETDIIGAVKLQAPATFDGMALRGIQVEQVSNEIWTGTVEYSPSELLPPPEYGDYLTSFSTMGQTENVQLALSQTRTSLVTAQAAPDFGNNINVDGDGIPQGVDIVVPKFEWSETHYIANSVIPGVANAWLQLIHNATGKTNSGAFRNFAPNSVLFLGANGAKRPEQDDWEVTFSFLAAPGVTLSLPAYEQDGTADDPVSVAKGGHEYIWFFNRRQEDTTAAATVTRAEAAYVATVYGSVAFTGAGGFMPQ
jgi:hypothetical protein